MKSDVVANLWEVYYFSSWTYGLYLNLSPVFLENTSGLLSKTGLYWFTILLIFSNMTPNTTILVSGR